MIVMSLLGLFDLRARLVGINQVIAVYMKSLNDGANVDFVPEI